MGFEHGMTDATVEPRRHRRERDGPARLGADELLDFVKAAAKYLLPHAREAGAVREPVSGLEDPLTARIVGAAVDHRLVLTREMRRQSLAAIRLSTNRRT